MKKYRVTGQDRAIGAIGVFEPFVYPSILAESGSDAGEQVRARRYELDREHVQITGTHRLDPVDDGTGIPLPEENEPYTVVVTIKTIRSGQPRPYADHERVERVTVRSYNYQGQLSDDPYDDDSLVTYALQYSGHDHLPTLDEWREAQKEGGMEAYFQTHLDSVAVVGPHTVEVRTSHPFTD